MNLNKLLSKDYFRLFIRREGRFMFGRRFSNLWIVSAMLVAMLLALSFSNASMKYLQYKMDDPFIRWLDIRNQGYGTIFNDLKTLLEEPDVQSKYHYSSVREDYQFSFFFFENGSTSKHYITVRMFESYDSPIFRTILDPDNVIDGAAMTPEELSQSSIGIIVTENALQLLKYQGAPAYVNLSADCSVTGETEGLEIYNGYAKVPIPVLAVVKRLPGSVDMVSTAFLYSGMNSFTFDLGAPDNSDFASSLLYYVPGGIEIDDPDFVFHQVSIPSLRSFGDGKLVFADTEEKELGEVLTKVEELREKYHASGVIRLFDYHLTDEMDLPEFPAYLSVQFDDLKKIPEFSEFVSSQTEEWDPERRISVDIAMTNAKENFNAVSVMASILSWALVIFSIMSILLFIVNLLQSYFQKVKKNLGTFKAFGMGNRELTAIYVIIIMAAILFAICMAIVIVWLLQLILSLFGIAHETGYPFFSLWSIRTVVALIAVLSAVYVTVRIVMRNLLRATPGDLIYDRQ